MHLTKCHGKLDENRNILGYDNPASHQVSASVQAQKRLVLLNIIGLATLIAFTGLVYLRTQETLVLLVGGLISVVSVLGTSMGKS